MPCINVPYIYVHKIPSLNAWHFLLQSCEVENCPFLIFKDMITILLSVLDMYFNTAAIIAL